MRGVGSARLLRRRQSPRPLNPNSAVLEAIAPMNSNTVYEVIAGIAMIITGLFLGYDEFWGVLMILLGVVLLVLWLARMGWL